MNKPVSGAPAMNVTDAPADLSLLDNLLARPVYQAYAYSYPHKTAYRVLEKKYNVNDLWLQEKLEALFLYVHIPFCSMRCGFCNLFTLVKPQDELPDRYLDALERQIKALEPIISHAKFARYAIGGGTPTYLSTSQLSRLFDLTDFSGMSDTTPVCIECSPETISADKIQLLEARGVNRISMGIQSLVESEVKNLVRRQNNEGVLKAIETIRKHSQADLNLDLIYGIAGQTKQSWCESLRLALEFKPEEFYLYPLYVREKTGLATIEDRQIASSHISEAEMLELYRVGRDLLLSEGYDQISMRMFQRRHGDGFSIDKPAPPVYSCQEDAMLGLGAGARSYTQKLHYSSEYAVGRKGVREIIEHYSQQKTNDFSWVNYGVELSVDEQKRRYVMQSLLITDGLDLNAYQQRFSSECLSDFSLLLLLVQGGLAEWQSARQSTAGLDANEKDTPASRLCLTEKGFERADSIGPWFSSEAVKKSMQEYTAQ